jgi:mannose-6-phosphate isomerase-like protein (cupin superfamily)
MIKKAEDMKTTYREHMFDGEKTTELLHIVDSDQLNHSRLFSKITVPVGGSVGSHVHHNETEYFYILSGEATTDEGDGPKPVSPGDVIITGDGQQHSITNTGSTPLEFIALIILDD